MSSQKLEDMEPLIKFSDKVEAEVEDLIETINSEDERYENMYWGQLMTLIDATFSDPIQRKAFKDSVKNIGNGIIELQPQPETHIRHFLSGLIGWGLRDMVSINTFPADIPVVVRYSKPRV